MQLKDLYDTQVVLENDRALLRPLQATDIDEFRKIAFDKDIWRYSVSRIYNEADLQDYMLRAFRDKEKCARYPFAIIDKLTGQVAGSTSYCNIFFHDSRLEIGFTWLAPAYQKTGLNRACKFLLVDYAFNQMGMQRVEFKTDAINRKSRNALKGIGAVQEGILRSHTLMHDGRRRNTVYFGILKRDWPTEVYRAKQ